MLQTKLNPGSSRTINSLSILSMNKKIKLQDIQALTNMMPTCKNCQKACRRCALDYLSRLS
eukprot:COSAG01_NODE_1_length_100484_cov_170.446142_6_plen_61_part_00